MLVIGNRSFKHPPTLVYRHSDHINEKGRTCEWVRPKNNLYVYSLRNAQSAVEHLGEFTAGDGHIG